MVAATSLPAPASGKSLFSQHYLDTRLPGHREWAEDPQAAFDAVQALWQKARQLGDAWNEAQTEDEFVKPVLAALGWSYIPQVKNSRSGRINRPDYALFADEAAKNAAYPHQGHDDAFYSRALAIAEAKYWGRPLGRKDASGRDTWKTDNNPSHQMVSYLVGARCPWGILTNGQVWRLYSREVSSTASEYYEVDLSTFFLPFSSEERGPGGEVERFKRFWLFFRRAAFTPDPQGRSFIQRIHEGSATYAREISDKLKELVFDEVMPEIAAGFVAYRRQQLGVDQESEEGLRQVYQASLSLLYKLLFVLYAEARNLLPMLNPAYREESLTRMARQFAERIDRGLAISDATHATRQYDSLLALFRRIDQGDPSLGIPRYDGGLFNPATPDNQFLAQHKLSDRAVARVVDILVRDAGQPVDYAYISVRNLGSIYEGLLENKLQVEPRPLGSLEDATSMVLGAAETPRVLLVNDKGERKATGSYYTPDYIVTYIVEQTLTPILDQRQGRFAAAMDRCAGLRGQLGHTAEPATVALLRRELDAAERQAREAFLGITCCDPAMGSGHFLVNAVDHITDGIIERMQAYHDSHPAVPWAWNPIQRLIERVRQEILAEMGRQGIAVDPARLDDTALLTRLVLKRCIYGVDLNPMAVELAKLSLWLHSFTVGAPLSFLDHHLRWGNSLLGADVRTVETAIRGGQSGQLALWGSPFASLLDLTTTMLEIADRADATLADVRQSAEDFRALQASLTPYKQALDLWVSQYFGNQAAGEFLTLHGEDVLPALEGKATPAPAHQAAIAEARRLWAQRRFFHWDLEFPEVFVDLARRDWAENPGFDAVIGNPPYVRQEWLALLKPYLQANYASFHSVADLYLYFYERGLRLLNSPGRLAYISSGTFARANFAAAFRRWLSSAARIESIIDFGENQPFVGAEMVRPSIVVIQNVSEASPFHSLFLASGVPTSLSEALSNDGIVCDFSVLKQTEWTFQPVTHSRLFAKLLGTGNALGDITAGSLSRGLITGLNEAFIIDETTCNRILQGGGEALSFLKSSVRGEDLRPWHQEHEGRWMIVIPSGWTRAKYGASLSEDEAWRLFGDEYRGLAEYLRPFAEAAKRRQDKGDYWWELRSCDYYSALDGTKILWPDVSKLPRFSWDGQGKYTNNTSYFVASGDFSLLGILQSRVTWFVVSQICQPLRLRAGLWQYRLFPQFLNRLPIPDAPTADRDAIAALALAVTEQARARYTVHRQTRHRILTDLGAPGAALNQKLTAWWELDFAGFMAEVRKVFKREIPLRQRDDWEEWLSIRRAEHVQRTAEIVRLETQLNQRVYTLFDLNSAEIKIVEESTKYRYGEV